MYLSLLLPITLAVSTKAAVPVLDPQYVPANTIVAVVPSVNHSSDKWQELKQKEMELGTEETMALFTARGFQVIPADKVLAAIGTSGIDFNDEEQWNKPNLFTIGKALHANLVAFVAIKETKIVITGNLLMRVAAGRADIETWLVDSQADKPVLDGVSTRKDYKQGIGGTSESRRLGAVKRAVDEAFKSFNKDYPETKK